MWVYGDQVNDHGDYEVFINDTRVAAHTGRSGCSGSSDQRCEKLHGVKFFGGPYPYGNHTLRVANTGAATFFGEYGALMSPPTVAYGVDLDYITWTTPHNWAAVSAAATSSQPSQPSSSTSASASKAPSKPSSAAAPFGAGDNTGILLITLAAWALGKFV